MQTDIQQIQAVVERESAFVDRLTGQIGSVIVGQKYLVERLLIGILADGHILIEGVPGLAKTLSVKTLSDAISVKFQRLQFTPDLLPADLIGTMIYNPQRSEFLVKKGPIFANIILADEINRAPAKVQSALLEAMQERQVTIGETTFPLDEPFLVLATQNPIEQEGTYPLPEAQVDRFMLKLKIGYPSPADEREIMDRNTGAASIRVEKVIRAEDIVRARQVIRSIYVDDKVKEYIVNIIFASREPEKYGLQALSDLISFGASPRATINLNLAAKAHAFLRGRGYITPEDIKAIGPDVLRHRILLTYEAEAEEVTSDDIVQKIFDAVEVP
ncbi:MAG: MoxR family ATPase [candidate division Zixibacteria bacterium]|jgi:MoxR-like ATPase|nr:MoxR family ATPase [candidate division Zixibacteria bacterium]